MGTSVLVSERKYLTTSYEPDCEYDDGILLKRNPGKPPEDRMSRVRKKIDEYLAFGVPYVWVIDPEERRADVYTATGFYEAKDGFLRTENPAIEVPLADLFQALDD